MWAGLIHEGDVVRVRPGDVVPADVKLLTGTSSVDQSALTGESKDVDKVPGEVLSSGAIVRRGEGNGVVILTGAKTYFGRTTQLVQIASPKLHIEAVISKQLESTPYLLGDKFCAADILFGSAVMYFKGSLFPEKKHYDAYVARLTARPAFQRSQAKDNG